MSENSNGSGFLPEGYEAPKGSGNYMKLQQGENRIRIISKPIIGWEDWDDAANKPIRYRMNAKPDKPLNPKKKVRHFWAMAVWNYATKSVAVLEIMQSSIQTAIQSLAQDGDWGNPLEYDIKINRTGTTLEDTEYTINPAPKKPLTDEIKQAILDTPVNLEALFENGNPFDTVPF